MGFEVQDTGFKEEETFLEPVVEERAEQHDERSPATASPR